MPEQAIPVEVKKVHCFRCSYDWFPKGEFVRRCPNCNSYCWHIEGVVKRGWPKGKKRKLT